MIEESGPLLREFWYTIHELYKKWSTIYYQQLIINWKIVVEIDVVSVGRNVTENI